MNSVGDLPFAIGLITAAIMLLPLVIGGIFVIVVVSTRTEVDPSGRRSFVIYAFATAFVTIFITLFASFSLVDALCQLIGSHGGGFTGGSVHPVGDSVARGCVLSLLLMAAAGSALVIHLRAALRASAGAPHGHPIQRLRATYSVVVGFVCILIAIISAVVATYQVFRAAGPGVFGGGNSTAAVRVLIPAVYLAVAALVILLLHLRQAPPHLALLFGKPVSPPPPPPAAEPPLASAAPRKRAPRRPPATKT